MTLDKLLIPMVLWAACLSGCGPSQKEVSEKGFASVEEMKRFQSLGYQSKTDFLVKSLSAVGKTLIDHVSSDGNARPRTMVMESEVFKRCNFKETSLLSGKTAKKCNLSAVENLNEPATLTTVNMSEEVIEVVALQIIRQIFDVKDKISMFAGIDGLTKEPIQCEFIDSESTATNNISVNLISYKGLKKFVVKEEFREASDKREHITTIYYNTSKNCKVLEQRQKAIDPIDQYASNPVFDDPAIPDSVKNLAIEAFSHGLADFSIEKIADMNHDGHDDFMAQGGSGYCGSAGCNHLIIHSVKKPGPNAAGPAYAVGYSGHFRDIQFKRDPKSKIFFTASLHGSECGKAGAEECKINYLLYRSKYMKEEDVIALTEIIPLERTLYCGFVNGRALDVLKRSSDRRDIPLFRNTYQYFGHYQEYVRRNHISNVLRSDHESQKSQVMRLSDAVLFQHLNECNRDRRLKAQLGIR
ncbi:MAG: hypothetical protein RL657_2190 [Pseudomonadota bacterium]